MNCKKGDLDMNIKTDSRFVEKGDTFIAIKGHTVDGHDYIDKAIENGASCIICSNNKTYSVKTINVKDTNEYLENLLVQEYAEKINKIKLVAITGTNGKTTTAYMTYELLRKLNINCAYIGTIGFYYNDNFEKTLNTTPDVLSLYNYLLKAIDNKCQIVIVEASSIGLVENRLAGLKFDIAVFTNLTHDHLDYHKTMTKYMEAKQILFKNLKENGVSIVNIDDKYSKNFLTKNNITYGFTNSDIKCTKTDEMFTCFTYTYQNKEYNLKSHLFGKYNIYNIMASIGILISLGINIDDINNNYADLEKPNGRINILDYKTNKIIIDYAHTPDGMKQVLTSAAHITKGKKYVVFGCPGNRDRQKRPIMGKMAQKYADYFILTDDDPHDEDEMQIINDTLKGITTDKYEVIIDRKKAITKAFGMLKENDTLLILGKGHENEIIIKDKRIKHNDLNFVQELINKSIK